MEEVVNGKLNTIDGIEKMIALALEPAGLRSTAEHYVYDNIRFEKVYGSYITCLDLVDAQHQWNPLKTNTDLLADAEQELKIELIQWQSWAIGEINLQ